MQGAPAAAEADLARQREIVDAFLAAARGGDFDALLAVLDPDVVLSLKIVHGKIVEIDVVTEPERLYELDLAVFNG